MLLSAASFCFASGLAWTLNRLSLNPWRRSAGQHWTERARLLYPARKSARMNTWLIPIAIAVWCYVAWPAGDFVFPAFFGLVGTLFAGFFFNRELFPGVTFPQWLHLLAALLFLFFLWPGILLPAIFLMPADFRPLTWIVAAGIFLLLVALLFGLGLRLLRIFHLLQPATERLKILVAEVSAQMNVPVRATWILQTWVPNAAAFPHTRQLLFTDKLLAAAPDDEIKAVCAHELGHLNEPRKVLVVRSLALFAFYPLIFARPLGAIGTNGTSVYLALVIVSLLLFLAGIRVARSMEKRADKIAAESQATTAVYAQALKRIYELNQAPAVTPRRSNKVHPDLYDRMLAAGVTPDFPKPLPPKGRCWTSYLVMACFVAVPVGIAFARTCRAALPLPGIDVH
ncbi:MAG TPA: M56 family metallopeptidase [Verrucomicrobiae bacterium]|nr:M56 family metallopeptidase [Verrucomicrobiae bacterium]